MSGNTGLADRVAAWATGVGIGWLTFMVSWLLGNRLTGLIWDPPTAPIVAMAAALGLGLAVAIVGGLRLSRVHS